MLMSRQPRGTNENSRSGGRIRPPAGASACRADHGGRESGREGRPEESGEGAGSIEERGLPGVAAGKVDAALSDQIR